MATCADYGIAALVIDFGSGMLKGKFAGDNVPHAVLPTIVGIPKSKPIIGRSSSCYSGDELRYDISIVKFTVHSGSVTSWDHMEKTMPIHTMSSMWPPRNTSFL